MEAPQRSTFGTSGVKFVSFEWFSMSEVYLFQQIIYEEYTVSHNCWGPSTSILRLESQKFWLKIDYFTMSYPTVNRLQEKKN